MPEKLGQGSGQIERTWLILRDIFYLNPGDALASHDFFQSSYATQPQYRPNLLTEIATQKMIWIQGFQLSHDYQFALTSSEPQGSKLHYFEQASTLAVEILEKSYSAIPYSMLVNHDFVFDGTNWVTQRKNLDKFLWPEEIEIPKGGNIKFSFVPCTTSLTLFASGITNPLIFNLSALTSNKGFTQFIKIIGMQERPSA
jgi:hypothetical protein